MDVEEAEMSDVDTTDPSAPAKREPIACTLDGEGVRRRLDEFRDVFEGRYLGSERIDGGGRWKFRITPGLDSRLRSLADREHECCRFFRFEIRAAGNELWWDTRVDDVEARPILEEFFTCPASWRSATPPVQRRSGRVTPRCTPCGAITMARAA
jgi:hypothetical protein